MSYKEKCDSAEVVQGDNEHRSYQKAMECDIKEESIAGIERVGSCAYLDYRTGAAPPQQEARNDHGTPPAPAVGDSQVFHGNGTN